MLKDLDNKEISVGDSVIFNDGIGVNKGKIVKITNLTIKVQYYSIGDVNKIGTLIDDDFRYIRKSSWNGKYIYKIC